MRFSWPRGGNNSGVRLERARLGSRLSGTLDMHGGQLFDMHTEIGYADKDSDLVSERFELVWECWDLHVKFGTVGQKSGHMIVVSQGVLVELNVIFFQGG
jgi:hypothetical protein